MKNTFLLSFLMVSIFFFATEINGNSFIGSSTITMNNSSIGLESFRDDRKYLIYDLNGKEVLSGDISSYMDFANFKFEVKE